jgi:tetratricopeptide (TPR) repeat protein
MMRCMLIFCLVSALFAGAGCDRKTQVSDEAERDHPAMRKARELENAGDVEGARFTYEALLDHDGSIARAHLALAFLLDKQGGNYIEALYHYQRYLTLRPDTEKRRMIDEHVRAAQLAYVGTVFTNEAAVLKKMAVIEKENATLKVRVSNLEAQSSQLRATVGVLRNKYESAADQASRSLDTVALPVPAPRAAGKMVRVEKGDSLRKIAIRKYGDQAKWRDIYEANRSQLKRPEDVRIGQMLLVPETSLE